MARRIALLEQARPGLWGRSAAPGAILATLRAHQLLLGLIGCYLTIGITASLLIPPWQAPDEPAHFEYIRNIQLGVADASPHVQQPIIASFYTYRFWQSMGMAPPRTPPTSFDQFGYLLIRQTGKVSLYYWLAAWVSGWTDDLLLQLASARWFSVLLSAACIPLAYATAREVMPPERARLALLAAAFVAFLPMHSYIGAAVNPDNIGTPLSAAALWLAVRALRGQRPALSLAGALLLAILAFWSRRSAVVIVPWMLLLIGACLFRRLQQWSPLAAVGAVVFGIALGTAAFAWPTDQVAGWTRAGPPWGATYSERYAFEGARSLQIIRRPHVPQAGLAQSFTLAQLRALIGRTVWIEALVRSDTTPVAGRLSIVVNRAQSTSTRFVATPEWQRATLSFAVPNDTHLLYVIVAAEGAGTLFVDQVAIRVSDPSVALAQLSNSGGEQVFMWWEDRFRLNTFAQYCSRIAQAARDGVYTSPKAQSLYLYLLDHLLTSFVGRFGWMTLSIGDWLARAVILVCAVVLAALPLAWVRPRRLEASQRRVLFWLAALVLAAIVTLLLEYIPYLYELTIPQGRYLFPVLSAIATLLVGGLAQLLPARHDRLGVATGVALLIALDLYAWGWVIVPHFYW